MKYYSISYSSFTTTYVFRILQYAGSMCTAMSIVIMIFDIYCVEPSRFWQILLISDFKIQKQTLERVVLYTKSTIYPSWCWYCCQHSIMIADAQVLCANTYKWDQISAAMVLTNIFRNTPVSTPVINQSISVHFIWDIYQLGPHIVWQTWRNK